MRAGRSASTSTVAAPHRSAKSRGEGVMGLDAWRGLRPGRALESFQDAEDVGEIIGPYAFGARAREARPARVGCKGPESRSRTRHEHPLRRCLRLVRLATPVQLRRRDEIPFKREPRQHWL